MNSESLQHLLESVATGEVNPADALKKIKQLEMAKREHGELREQAERAEKQAIELLEQAERRVEILSGIDAEGNPITEPIEEVEETIEEKRHSRGAKRTAARRNTAPRSPKSGGPDSQSEEPGLI